GRAAVLPGRRRRRATLRAAAAVRLSREGRLEALRVAAGRALERRAAHAHGGRRALLAPRRAGPRRARGRTAVVGLQVEGLGAPAVDVLPGVLALREARRDDAHLP